MTRTFPTVHGDLSLDVCQLGHPKAKIFITLAPMTIHGSNETGDKTTSTRLRPGTILMPRRDPKTGKEQWQIFRFGLYDALRACLQIREHYHGAKGEVAQLQKAHQTFHDLVFFLLQNYHSLISVEKEQISQMLQDWQKAFLQARNPFKQDALNQIAKTVYLTDSRGRLNPGATNARLTAARRRLTSRLQEIGNIDPHIALRQIELIQERIRIERVLTICYFSLQSILKINLPSWRRLLTIRIDELQTIKVGPFPAPVFRIITEMQQAMAFFEEKKTKQAQRLLCRAMEAIRCKKGQSILSDILLKVDFLSRQDDKIKSAQKQDIIAELEEFLARLQTVDDINFTVPVRKKVSQLIIDAIAALEENNFKEARNSLRHAQRAL